MPLSKYKSKTFYSTNLYDYLGQFKYMSEIKHDLSTFEAD